MDINNGQKYNNLYKWKLQKTSKPESRYFHAAFVYSLYLYSMDVLLHSLKKLNN